VSILLDFQLWNITFHVDFEPEWDRKGDQSESQRDSLTDCVLSLRITVKVCRWPFLLLMSYREPGFTFYL